MLIDSHAHLDMYETAEELAGVLSRAAAEGIGAILAIGIGEGPETMHQALAIAKAQVGGPEIFASVGIHPEQAHNATEEALGDLARLAQETKCLAIGEIGLDYYHASNPDVATQQAAFVAQMAIARELRKPILIHCDERRSWQRRRPRRSMGRPMRGRICCGLLGEHWAFPETREIGGVMHCFSGTPEHARRSVEAGFSLSFAGNLTYPKSAGIRQAAAEAPAQRILVETDCPFLAPIPYRGQRCEPAMMTHTAALLAQLRGLPVEELAKLTTQNFHNLFPSTGIR